ncbi:reverse transcriptase domain-containing protein [Paenibacillus luteus]|uniref:reverse transcriptase domain-containing protein n=1 Tax=Paenibacillus luteus TaxID=2545753 RepID=UPI00114426D8|nr:reverse transcriptase domain-containing protein [Paenibacillus luteus]
MSSILYSPTEIPLHYYYFGWKKARSFVKQQGFYDPIEIKEFELELEKNLSDLQEEVSSLFYEITPPVIYGFPKGVKDNELKLRPMSKITFRDQVVWATVVLTIGEYFDTNDYSLMKDDYVPDGLDLQWMVDWSCNNRLRRKYYPSNEENSYEFQRFMINYTHNDLYESFQRSLRLQRKKQEEYFEQVLKKSPIAFYGQADITKFYPSLKMNIVEEVLKDRLNELSNLGLIDHDICKKWTKLLESICNIRSDLSYLLEDEFKSIGFEEINRNLSIETLPTGLIASGFLANCVLTKWLDHPMDDYLKEKTDEGSTTFLTRYTDDIMIISTNEKVIFEGIKKIRDLIDSIGLKLSEDKTKPKLKEDLVKSLIKERGSLTIIQANELVEQYFKEDTKCPQIGEYDALPSSTALIDKLSQLGDQQVRAMRGDELEKYLSELMDLVNTEFADAEIRGDTKSSFAAWRIRKAAKDAQDREMGLSQNITETLKRSYMKYPYKMSLVNCYILHLMELPFDDRTENFITEMFKSAKKTDKVTLPGFYGGYLRTHILFAISDNWMNLTDENRLRMRKIIFEQVSNWYEDNDSPTWHEQYAIYWLFTNSKIQTDLNLFKISKMQSVNRAYNLFNLMNQQIECGNDSVLVAIMSQIWKRNRLRGQNDALLSDEASWIKWVWRNLSNVQKTWKWKLNGHERVWIEISEGRESEITVFGFRRLLEISELQMTSFYEDNELHQDDEESVRIVPIFNGVTEILNQAVTLWASQTDLKFSDRFLRALRSIPEEYRIRKYLTNRLANLKEIEKKLINNNSIIGNNSAFLKNVHSSYIPLQDWLEIINIVPQRIETKKMPSELLPLTEVEITSLLIQIGTSLSLNIEENKDDQNNFDRFKFLFNMPELLTKVSLNRISVKIEDWRNWRHGQGEFEFEFTENYVIYSEYYLNAWAYTNTYFVDDEYLLNYALSMLMLRLISKRKFRSRSTGISKLRGWNKISDVVAQAEFPSTALAEIITGSMNYQKPFYNNLNLKMGIELPLLPLEKEPIMKVQEYLTRLKEHLAVLKKRFFIGDTGLREIRYIDIDKLVKE